MNEMERIIFGIKLGRLRRESSMSFQNLSAATGISVSYLNEMEKGKKAPRADKIELLENALGVRAGYLTDPRLSSSLHPLGNLLSSGFLKDLPLETFGISHPKVIQAIAEAPIQIGAFIQTLLDFTRTEHSRGNHFYTAALQTYKELCSFNMEEAEQSAIKHTDHSFQLLTSNVARFHWLKDILTSISGWKVSTMDKNIQVSAAVLPCFVNPKSKTILLHPGLDNETKVYCLQWLRAHLALGLPLPEYLGNGRNKHFQDAIDEWKIRMWMQAVVVSKNKIVERVMKIAQGSGIDENQVAELVGLAPYDTQSHLERIAGVIYQHLKIRDVFLWVFSHDTDSQSHVCTTELYARSPKRKLMYQREEHHCRYYPGMELVINPEKYPSGFLVAPYFLETLNAGYLCISHVRDSLIPGRKTSYTIGMNARHLTGLQYKPTEMTHTPVSCERCARPDCPRRAAYEESFPFGGIKSKELEKTLEKLRHS